VRRFRLSPRQAGKITPRKRRVAADQEQLFARDVGQPMLSSRRLRLIRAVNGVPLERLTITDARRFVTAVADRDLTVGSARRFSVIWQNFDRYARLAHQVTEIDEVDVDLVRAFSLTTTLQGNTPSPGTQSARISALRYLFKTLRTHQLIADDPTYALPLPRRAELAVRPLTDADIERCRWAAETALDAAERYQAAFALFEAGAGPGEAAEAKWADVSADGRVVALSGGRTGRPRSVTTTRWGAHALVEARHYARSEWVALLGARPYDSARTSATSALKEIFRRSGVGWAEPRSITSWVARRVFAETGRLEDAARVIGFFSLDRTAELIHYEWWGSNDG
jgi:integrase